MYNDRKQNMVKQNSNYVVNNGPSLGCVTILFSLFAGGLWYLISILV